jgi:HD-like signal output (HDOD) protein
MTNKTAITFTFKQYPVLLPDTVKIFNVCNKNAVNVYELLALINSDPVLTAISYGLYHEFFPTVQKEFFGIPRIITVLGINTVKNFILNAAKRGLSNTRPGINLSAQSGFLRRSLAAAVISYLLARERGIRENRLKEYYCAGLLQNIGEFIVSEDSGAEFNVPRKTLAREEAGGLAAALWGFPATVAEAVSYNRNSSADIARHSALSAYLADTAVSSNKKYGNDITLELFKRLDVPENIFESIKTPFAAELKRMETFLGLEGN